MAVGGTNMNPKKSTISAIVIAKNEQERIKKCLNALTFCDEILLVDNGSTDDTVRIAKKYDAVILTQKNADFATLRNLAKGKATGEWLLYVDSDEVVSDCLADEILGCIQGWKSGEPRVYQLHRKNYYLGRPWPNPEWMSRLFYASALVKWQGTLHESPITHGSIARLHGLLFHHTHRSLEQMVDKTNAWSDIEARLRYDAHHPHVSWWRLIRVMTTAFWYTFVQMGGWRAGVVGWIESIFQAFSMFITYAKLWELQQKQR